MVLFVKLTMAAAAGPPKTALFQRCYGVCILTVLLPVGQLVTKVLFLKPPMAAPPGPNKPVVLTVPLTTYNLLMPIPAGQLVKTEPFAKPPMAVQPGQHKVAATLPVIFMGFILLMPTPAG